MGSETSKPKAIVDLLTSFGRQMWVSQEEWQQIFGPQGPVFIVDQRLVEAYETLGKGGRGREITEEIMGEVVNILKESHPKINNIDSWKVKDFLVLASLIPNADNPFIIKEMARTEGVDEAEHFKVMMSALRDVIRKQSNGVTRDMTSLLIDPLRELGLQAALDEPGNKWRRKVTAKAEVLIPQRIAGSGNLNWLQTAVMLEIMALMNREIDEENFTEFSSNHFLQFARSNPVFSGEEEGLTEEELIEGIRGISYVTVWLLGDHLFFRALTQSGYSNIVLESLKKQLSQLWESSYNLKEKGLRKDAWNVVKERAIYIWCYFVAGQSALDFWRLLISRKMEGDDLETFLTKIGNQLEEIVGTIRQLDGKNIGPYGPWEVDKEETEETKTDSADRVVRTFKGLVQIEKNILRQAPTKLLTSTADNKEIFYSSNSYQVNRLADNLFWDRMSEKVRQLARGVHTDSHAVIGLF